jgi:hypothetical protein
MKICKVYGVSFELINFVKNELSENSGASSKFIYNRAKQILNDDRFNLTDVSDLVFHLSDN